MPPNGPDEWRARIGHWENRKLRLYQAHCGSRPRVPLNLHLERMISEAPLLCVLLLLSLVGKVGTGVCEAGNGTLSGLGKLVRCCGCGRRRRVWATPLSSLFLALSLLLVAAGDVETNPGPISGEGKHFNVAFMHVNISLLFPSEELLAQVDDSVLSKFICDLFSSSSSPFMFVSSHFMCEILNNDAPVVLVLPHSTSFTGFHAKVFFAGGSRDADVCKRAHVCVSRICRF